MHERRPGSYGQCRVAVYVVWWKELRKHRNSQNRWSEWRGNQGEIVAVGRKDGGGHALVEDLDNEAGDGVACWLDETKRLAAVEALAWNDTYENVKPPEVLVPNRRYRSDYSHHQIRHR
jgi:hypothetical protein